MMDIKVGDRFEYVGDGTNSGGNIGTVFEILSLNEDKQRCSLYNVSKNRPARRSYNVRFFGESMWWRGYLKLAPMKRIMKHKMV